MRMIVSRRADRDEGFSESSEETQRIEIDFSLRECGSTFMEGV